MPNRALNDSELMKYAKQLKIPNFRGVFMRDTLPYTPRYKECAIFNLDTSNNPGTHWVAYVKKNNSTLYFDSFGGLKPPKELSFYLGRDVKITYNTNSYQKYNQITCGHLCLEFLYKNT